MHKANEGQLVVGQGVADGGIATTGIPAQQAIRREAHAGQVFDAIGEGDVLRRGLNDIGAAAAIEYLLRAAQVAGKGLAVRAITDAPIYPLGLGQGAFELAATTA